MMITLTFAEIMTILGFSLSFAVAFGGLLWRIHSIGQANYGELKKELEVSKESLGSYKLFVAQQYVSLTQISEMNGKILQTEQRLFDAINNLTQRVDRMLTRMERSKE